MTRTKVLLIEDVPNLGLAGEVHVVAGGYARNYLMPRGEAIPASKGAMNQAEEIRRTAQRKRAQERANAEAQAEIINQQKLLFQVRAGDNGRLYGSVTSSDIAEMLEEKVGFEVDRRRLLLDAALRDLGIFEIEHRLMAEVSTTFQVALVREEEGWEDAEKRQAAAKEAAQAAEEAAAAEQMAVEAAEAAESDSEEESTEA